MKFPVILWRANDFGSKMPPVNMVFWIFIVFGFAVEGKIIGTDNNATKCGRGIGG